MEISQAFGLESLDLFSVSKQGPCLTVLEEYGDLYDLDLLVKMRLLLRQILINLAFATIAETILLRIPCTGLLSGT